MANPSLVDELCRCFNSKRVAMLCALIHGQVTIDGFIVRAKNEHQWTPEQLRGRMAQLNGRHVKLYENRPYG